jgi:RNA polymerase sigma-70 factor (ECF subfamily)
MKTNRQLYAFIDKTKKDEELVKLALNNPVYFEDIVARYQKLIIGFHYNFLKNRQDAEDLAQDTFLKIYLNLNRFNSKKGKFKDWVFKIAKNIFIDFLRKNSKKYGRVIAFSRLTDAEKYFSKSALDDNFENGRNIADFAEGEEMKKEFAVYFDKLEPDEKNLLKKLYFDGFSYKELGKNYMCGVNTIKSRLRRARLSLRRILEAGNFNNINNK